jgi:NADPH-dependent glutamate synthase beta subunit-like oxidoreductase
LETGFDIDQAVTEANRCLLCYDPPCSKACPAQTDPGTFIRKLRLRNVTGAIRTIKENNILGGACGILCPTARLCEKECSACGIDRPIKIGKIQSFLVEHGRKAGIKATPAPAPAQPQKVAVIGSGPAGLACAATVARAGHPVTVFESREKPGGVLRYGVPSFRFPDALLDHELADLRELDIEIRCSSPIAGKGAAEKLLKTGYKAVFVGCGLWDAAPLHDGPRPPEVSASIDFLAAFRDCKQADLKKSVQGKVVAVIGGGSVAIDCARVALALGARDVYLIYRRSFSQMPAEVDERLEALDEGIHFLVLNQPTGYQTDTRGRLTGVKLVRTTLGEPDADGRRRPVEIKGSEWVQEAGFVVEAIGNRAPAAAFDAMPSAARTRSSLLKADEKTGKTSVPGLFAGGDIVRGPALVVEAIRDGKAAGNAIIASLKGGKTA